MRIISKSLLVLFLFLCATPVISQENGCSAMEKRYEEFKTHPVLGQQAMEELCNCYLSEVEAALENNRCDVAQEFYSKYKNFSGKTNSDLEQRILDCQHPPQGTLVIKGDKSLLKQSDVRINGNKVSNPTQEQSLLPGSYKLTVKHEDYDLFEKNFQIEKRGREIVEVVFECYGWLWIEGNDITLLRNSKIYLDDVKMSNPPIQASMKLRCGLYSIRVVHEGCRSFEKQISITSGKRTTLIVNGIDMPVINKDKYGYLQFQDNTGVLSNSSCKVYIDEKTCLSPKETQKLKIGTHSIRIEYPDYETQTGNVTIEENKTKSFIISMKARPCNGYIKIDSDKNKQTLKEATIFIDDKKISSFPFGENYELSCGSHMIRIELNNYKPIEGEVVIEKGKTRTFVANFPTKGSLILKGDSSLLSGAKITIDGKDARYAVKRPQDLDIGKHSVRVELDCFKPFEQTVTIKGGEPVTLNIVLMPTCKEITFYASTDTHRPCEIYLDGQYKGLKQWTEELPFGRYDVESRRRGFKSSKRTIYIDENTDKSIYLKSKTFKNFITGNVAYGFAPQWSFGISYGRLQWKHTYNYSGWFVSVMAKSSSVSKAGDCDAEGFLANGSFPGYNGTQKRSRFSIMAGLMFPLSEDYSHIRIGAGYGTRSLYWESNDGLYYKNLGYSVKGLEGSVGLQFRFNRIIVSADYVVTDFKFKQFSEIKIGVGGTF